MGTIVWLFNQMLKYNKCPSALKSNNFLSNIHQRIISTKKNNFESEGIVLL